MYTINWKFISLIMFLSVTSPAAFEVQTLNTSAVALGSIASLYPGSSNPACFLTDETLYLRVDYTRLFGLTGLDYYQSEGRWKFRDQRQLGIGFQNFGNRIYQEKTLGIRYGHRLKNLLALGLSVQLYNVAISGCQNSTALGLNLGSVWDLDDDIQVGMLLQNVNSPAIYGHYDPLPECFLLGIRYTPVSKIDLCGELFKDTEFPFSFRMGTIIRPLPFVELKLGAQLNPDRYAGGISLYLKGIYLDFAYQHHQVLPYTLYYGIGYGF